MSMLDRQLRAFAAHLRAPDTEPAPPGIEQRRLSVYRELFANNIRTLLAGNFPVMRKTLGEETWAALVRGFFAGFRSHTPLFPEIGQEFLRYLQQRQDDGADDPAWLCELAHYEWVELALQIADDALPAHDPDGDLLAGIPVLSPLAWPLAYRWPVHAIGPGQVPAAPGPAPTLLLVRRDPAGDVRFSELSPLVYRLLELLGEGAERSGGALLSQLAEEAQAGDRAAFLQQGAAMLARLHEEGTILGTR